MSENYRKLRNTLRFLLGNLHDFIPAEHAIEFHAMEPLDQYILAQAAELDAKVRKAYDEFEFHRAYHAINEFTNSDLSALYLDVIKDRLYTMAPGHPARRSAQTALWRIAEALTRLIAPILSFTADEVWPLLPAVKSREESVHLAMFPDLADIVPGSTAAIAGDWERLLSLRALAMLQLEAARKSGAIGKGLEAVLTFDAKAEDEALLQRYEALLPELMGVSASEIRRGGPETRVDVGLAREVATKCERCWRYTQDVGQERSYPSVCLRCAEALAELRFPPFGEGEA